MIAARGRCAIAGRGAALVLALSLPVGSALAVVLPDDVQTALNQRYDAFVDTPGFTTIELTDFRPNWDDWYTHSRFPHENPRGHFAVPDAGINAATRALMLLESKEKPLPHARYRIIYRLDNAPDFGGYPNAYVEVTRFNLGPAIRADVADSTPKGVPVAPPKHFGLGPSVSWRFVMGWQQGGVAAVIRASRSALSAGQAKAVGCLGTPCMALENPRGPAGEWKQITPPSPQPVAYVSEANGVSTAARISELLYRHASAGRAHIEALPMHADTPQLIFVISMNIEGQDHTADGLLHQQLLRDDAVSDIWTRRRDAGRDTVEWREYVEYHPGRS